MIKRKSISSWRRSERRMFERFRKMQLSSQKQTRQEYVIKWLISVWDKVHQACKDTWCDRSKHAKCKLKRSKKHRRCSWQVKIGTHSPLCPWHQEYLGHLLKANATQNLPSNHYINQWIISAKTLLLKPGTKNNNISHQILLLACHPRLNNPSIRLGIVFYRKNQPNSSSMKACRKIKLPWKIATLTTMLMGFWNLEVTCLSLKLKISSITI